MPLATYNDLKASIADFLNRSDLTNAIPDFISLGKKNEQRNTSLAYGKQSYGFSKWAIQCTANRL